MNTQNKEIATNQLIKAPELRVSHWIDKNGNQINTPIKLVLCKL